MTTLHLRKSISRSPLRLVFLLIPLAFACFTLSPQARASCHHGCSSNGNTVLGDDALLNSDPGDQNTAVGFNALLNNRGDRNTANGYQALFSNLYGASNTANGYQALYSNTYGSGNTANGNRALYSNTDGASNTANGYQALFSNTGGSGNTANGNSALSSNTEGTFNTATGSGALFSNNEGTFNTANGYLALQHNTYGNYNTASGGYALVSNTTGIANTAIGVDALYSNITGSNNTGVGVNALLRSTGSSNVGLGSNAGKNLTTGSGNVCIGVNVFGVAAENNTTRIRNIYASVASGRTVYVNADSKIGTLMSSRRFKDEIKPMDKASETILALKPVAFHYKKEIDASGTLQFGLVAEEVADINADLVTRDSEGNPETVRYEAVNAMLLNEFLKEHRTVQELKSNAAKQEATIAQQQKQIEALTAGLQKVSAQLETGKPAPQVVSNNQ